MSGKDHQTLQCHSCRASVEWDPFLPAVLLSLSFAQKTLLPLGGRSVLWSSAAWDQSLCGSLCHQKSLQKTTKQNKNSTALTYKRHGGIAGLQDWWIYLALQDHQSLYLPPRSNHNHSESPATTTAAQWNLHADKITISYFMNTPCSPPSHALDFAVVGTGFRDHLCSSGHACFLNPHNHENALIDLT